MENEKNVMLNTPKVHKTKAKDIILQLLQKTGRPLTHPEIISRKSVSTLDRVTIYRALEKLHGQGIVHKILGIDGIWRYCTHNITSENKCAANHIHFLCSRCNQMTCLPEQPLPWVIPPKGATIQSKQLVVNGLCIKCSIK